MRRKLSIFLLISVTVFYSCKAQAEQKNKKLISMLGQFYKTIHKKETPIARGLFLFFQ
jgi:hypothetical protein